MPKAYWVVCHRSVPNLETLSAYAKLAGPALASYGGRYLTRGMPAKTYEAGVDQRCVVIEFDSLQTALAAHESTAYQAALKVFDNAAERDIRIIEGLD